VTVDTKPWIDDLGTDDLFRFDPAADKLAALGDAAVPALAAAFDGGDAQLRLGVVEVLRDIGTPAAHPLLLRAASDSDQEVRADAILALGVLRVEDGTAIVEHALGDENPRINRAAAVACRSVCRSEEGMRHLARIAVHGEPAIAKTARESVHGLLGREDRADRARAAVESIAATQLDSRVDPITRVRAALLLVEIDTQRALPWLRYFVESGDHPLVQFDAFLAIGKYGGSEEVPFLVRLRDEPERPMTASACKALGLMAKRGIEGAGEKLAGCPREGQPAERSRF
jgi:HEAT repeat protein